MDSQRPPSGMARTGPATRPDELWNQSARRASPNEEMDSHREKAVSVMDFDEKLAELPPGRRDGRNPAHPRQASGLREVHLHVAESLTFGARPDNRFGGGLLVIDELVGNACRHTAAAHELCITRKAQHLLIEVSDRDLDATAVRV